MILATLCYLRREGKTLMLHRNKKEGDVHRGKWNGLGGKFEPGETPEACAIREIREESGLQAQSLEMKGILTFPMFSHGHDWYVFLFVVDRFIGELQASPEGELHWIDDEKLLALNLWEGDQTFLPWLSQPGWFSGEFVYKAGKLVDHSVRFYGTARNTVQGTARNTVQGTREEIPNQIALPGVE